MLETVRPHDPAFFTGAGLRPLPGEEKQAESVIRRLEEMVEFNRADTPWVMAEFVFDTDHPGALEYVRQAITLHIAASDIHCPTKPDPEVPTTAEFPHPFIVGPSADPAEPTYLLSGTVGDRFLAAWEKYGRVYFELHLWVRRTDPARDESLFMWLVLGKDSPLKVIVQESRPVIIPVDETRKYRCLYAAKKGWAPGCRHPLER